VIAAAGIDVQDSIFACFAGPGAEVILWMHSGNGFEDLAISELPVVAGRKPAAASHRPVYVGIAMEQAQKLSRRLFSVSRKIFRT
jgi:hypothetical protein